MSNRLLTKLAFSLPQSDCLNQKGCQCSVCSIVKQQKANYQRQKQKQCHGFILFLNDFPTNIPLLINSTTAYSLANNSFKHYSNGNKLQNKKIIFKTKMPKLLTAFPISSNIKIFGNNFSKIVGKHQANSFIKGIQQNYDKFQSNNPQKSQNQNARMLKPGFQKVLYIQAYYCLEIPHKVIYEKNTIKSKLDRIIWQYIQNQQNNFHPEKPYQVNQQFWQWIYSEYGQQTFIYFITQFYVRVYNVYSKNILTKAVFQWAFEWPKNQFGQNVVTGKVNNKNAQSQYYIAKTRKLNFKIRLLNVKNLQIEYLKNLISFQEQYQQKILTKIKTQVEPKRAVSKDQSKRSYLYQNRLDTFQSKVRDLFLNQQNQVLKKVEKEQSFSDKEDSDQLARLFIPNMGQFQTIRQVLNDQNAFQKFIYIQEKRKEKERLNRARQMILADKKPSLFGKNSFQLSRIKTKQFNSRRIRVKTEYC